jgi:hypothetical protein
MVINAVRPGQQLNTDARPDTDISTLRSDMARL